MEKKIQLKFYVLILLLSVSAVAANRLTEVSGTGDKKPEISNFFEQIDGYKLVEKSFLPEDAEAMLNLDDYYFADYVGAEGRRVNLYIGYYYTADKAYQAHSPLVCYPSQGWTIEKKAQQRHLDLGNDRINYEEIVTSYGKKKELVFYWYQADRLTTTNAYVNKLNAGLNRITRNSQQHAFIRVATPIDSEYEITRNAAEEFISVFYPKLLIYMDK